MRVIGGLSLVMALFGCSGGETDSDTDAAVDDGCPTGLERALNGAVVLTQFTYGGIDRFLGFDATKTYAEGPALCRSADGARARWIVEQGTEPFGWIDVSAPTAGSYAANEVAGGYLTVNLFGSPEQAVFAGPAAWQQGTVEVTSTGATFEVGMTAVVGFAPTGENLTFTASAEAAAF